MTVLTTLQEGIDFMNSFESALGEYPLIIIGTNTRTIIFEAQFSSLAKQELSNLVNHQNMLSRFNSKGDVETFRNPIRVDFAKSYKVGG